MGAEHSLFDSPKFIYTLCNINRSEVAPADPADLAIVAEVMRISRTLAMVNETTTHDGSPVQISHRVHEALGIQVGPIKFGVSRLRQHL